MAIVLTMAAHPLPAGNGSGMHTVAQAMDAYWKADYEGALRLLDTVDPAALSAPEKTLFFKVRGLSLFAKGDREGAKAAFRQAVSTDPNFRLDPAEFSPPVIRLLDEVRSDIARDLSKEAMSAYDAGRYREALELFDRALVFNPKDPVARDFRGLARARVAATPPTPTPAPEPVEPVQIASPDSCIMGLLDIGEHVYTDRGYVLAKIPEKYRGLPSVRTPNSAKTRRDFVLRLKLTYPAQLYVAYDSRVRERPHWLQRFSPTGDRIEIIEIREGKRKLRKYDVYRAWVSPGNMDLGPNLDYGGKGQGKSMYFVFLQLENR